MWHSRRGKGGGKLLVGETKKKKNATPVLMDHLVKKDFWKLCVLGGTLVVMVFFVFCFDSALDRCQ